MRPEAYSRFSFDKRAGDRPSFVQARKTERYYGAQLRKIARHIGELVSGSPPSDLLEAATLAERLRQYAKVIQPWAASVAQRMIADVSRRDRDVWRARSAEMGQILRREIESAHTAPAIDQLMAEQVALITSLPTEAAQRVHRLTLEGLTNSTRAEQISQEIMRTGQVTRSRANLIARTEVGRVATTITKVRAEHVGSTAYIWRTSRDGDVRHSHKLMEGRVVSWADPPVLDGLKGHAGALPNCRCYPETIIPEF